MTQQVRVRQRDGDAPARLRVVIFCHSLISDWNHGNAHFIRGIVTELMAQGHTVDVYEPHDSWSLRNLVAEYGEGQVRAFRAAYPLLTSNRYTLETLDLDECLEGADLVIVHEWNDHRLVKRIGDHRQRSRSYRLLFHDTHHRSATDPDSMSGYDLSDYDGVLAFGKVIRDTYIDRGWARQAWTWHEAADTRRFRPIPLAKEKRDLVWVGNWGDDERTTELQEFLLGPVAELKLKSSVYGVRYPQDALDMLAASGADYLGWLPNYRVPEVFSRFKVTVHVPRRPYVKALPGIPTIRVFEALACGVPLVCSPWSDDEGLFTPGKDFLIARNGREMTAALRGLVNDHDMRQELSSHGLATVSARHTCAHRVRELMEIYGELTGQIASPAHAVAALQETRTA